MNISNLTRKDLFIPRINIIWEVPFSFTIELTDQLLGPIEKN